MTDVAFQRIKSLLREGLKLTCARLGDPDAADAFTILDPSPPHEGDLDRSVHISRDALASEGRGLFTSAMRTLKPHDMPDEEVATRPLVMQSAVSLIRARMREREIARMSPDDPDPAWASHVHVLFDACMREIEREAGVPRMLCMRFDHLDETPGHPFGIARPRTAWSDAVVAAEDARYGIDLKPTSRVSGRIEQGYLEIRLKDARPETLLKMRFRTYAAIEFEGPVLPSSVAVGIPDMHGHPVGTFVDMALFDGHQDMAVRYPSYDSDKDGKNEKLRLVLPDRRTLLAPPPAGADLSFLTIGREMLNAADDDVVLIPEG